MSHLIQERQRVTVPGKPKVCTSCKKEKPETEFIKVNSALKKIADGSVKYYVYRETTCNQCRRTNRTEYMKEYRKKNPRPRIRSVDINGFWFCDDIRVWCHGPDKERWNKVYQDKKEREELRHPFARV